MTTRIDIWEFRSTSGHVLGSDLIGFHVEATDGPVGTVHGLSEEAGAQYLVVDTGPWIFGRRVLLPAGTVVRVEQEERKVYVDRTKDEIKESPEFQPDGPGYLEKLGAYYGPFYGVI